jgi:hypothetical protein
VQENESPDDARPARFDNDYDDDDDDDDESVQNQ